MISGDYCYPIISASTLLSAVDFSFSYVHNGVEEPLNNVNKFDDNHFEINTDGVWELDSDGLCVKGSIQLKTGGLFGAKGVACADARLGIAVIWHSKKSRRRGVARVIDFGINDTDINVTVPPISFDRPCFCGSLSLTTVLYIHTAGLPAAGEEFLANKAGMLVGELDSREYSIEGGTEALFPILLTFDAQKPLWFFEWDKSADPKTDTPDRATVYLNKAHKDYKFIDKHAPDYNPPFLAEVLSSAVCLLIDAIRCSTDPSDWDDIQNGKGLAEDSIGNALYYMKNTFGLDLSDPAALEEGLKKYLRGKY